MKRLLAFAMLAPAVLALGSPALANSLMPSAQYANTQLEDPAKEKAARDLMESIRCLVCQGQSIADSDADMAGDMRGLIRERVAKGEQPEAIRAWLVERYGNWVTYKPPMGGAGAALWLAPLAFVLIGLFLVGGRLRRKR